MLPSSVQTGKIQNFSAVRQTSTSFDLELFLRSGWLFSLDADRVLLGWGGGVWAEKPSSDDLCALYAPDFYLMQKKPWWICRAWTICHFAQLRDVLQEKLQEEKACDATKVPTWLEPDPDLFADLFLKIQKEFKKNKTQKVVPVVMASAVESPQTFSLARTLLNVLQRPSHLLRPYGWWGESEGILGLTPEILFSKTPLTLKTMALAGTRRGLMTDMEEQHFLRDPKETREHSLVVGDLQKVLSQWGAVKVSPMFVTRLPNLAHLQTNLEVALSAPLAFQDAVACLHPTPALGVAPRSLGLEWLQQWEGPQQRRRFGAPFGVRVHFSDAIGSAARGDQASSIEECLVAIRNIQWQDAADAKGAVVRRFQLGSGCGVVPQSDLLSEWQELAAKRASVRHLLQV